MSESGVGEVQEVSGFDGDLEMSINENDYIQLNIDPAKLDSIQSIAFNFAYISDDGKAIVFLGKDNDLECDWEKVYSRITSVASGVLLMTENVTWS